MYDTAVPVVQEPGNLILDYFFYNLNTSISEQHPLSPFLSAL